jgi:hypothetical protein
MTVAIHFDVPFEIVFEHCESFESTPQIMNDLPEHSRNQVFSTECKRGRHDVRFIDSNCVKRAPNKHLRANVMTMSWHMMIEFEPPLVACVVSNANHSFAALRTTKE